MKRESASQDKSFAFAVRVVAAYRQLAENGDVAELGQQLLRCGIAIGSHVNESTSGLSRSEFLASMEAAYAEAHRTDYWLRLLRASELLDADLADALLEDCDILLRILGSACHTTRKGLQAQASA